MTPFVFHILLITFDMEAEFRCIIEPINTPLPTANEYLQAAFGTVSYCHVQWLIWKILQANDSDRNPF